MIHAHHHKLFFYFQTSRFLNQFISRLDRELNVKQIEAIICFKYLNIFYFKVLGRRRMI